jgi:ribosomal protein L11 methyltransferase
VIRLAVRVKREQAELVLAELLELAPAGVEELNVGEQIVEYAVYGTPGELPALPDVSALVGDALVEISTSDVADDWEERWRDFHRPVLIASPREGGQPVLPALHVRPPWEAPRADADGPVREIVIDPGQAFGTGAHASTRMCLELLLELAATEVQHEHAGPLLDIGTGSGVLAIAAAGLGFAPVLALDNERESVAAARENATANVVEIEVRRFDLRADELPWIGDGDRLPGPLVVTANLLRPLLLELSRTMPRAPAHLLASGLLREEVDEIAGAFGDRLGLRERERRESGEWAAVWLTGAADPSPPSPD